MHLLLLASALAQQLPVPQDAPTPVFPQAALARGQSATVLLQLAVDDTGRVTVAEVLESAALLCDDDPDPAACAAVAPEFDAAALQVGRNLTLTPALDADGNPVPAVIGYRVQFEPQAVAVISLQGQVLEAGARGTVPSAEILLIGPDGGETVGLCDADGAFALADLAPGTYQVAITAPGFQPETTQVDIQDGAITELTVRLVEDRPWEGTTDAALVVEGRRATPEITERVLDSEQIRYLPGTSGDVVRVVQNLPGVARPPLNIGQLLIRGTSPEASRYYVDGVNLPLVFHFSGLSTVINSDSIEEVAFLPGNYGVRYGRTQGGVVDIRTTTELPELSRGYVQIDLYQTTAFVEQRVGDRTAITFSGRRSYIDAVLNPVLRNTSGLPIQAPRFWDFQTRALHMGRNGTRWDAMLLVSDDRFAVVGEDEETTQIGLSQSFAKLRLQATTPVGELWSSQTSLMFGPERQEFVITDGEAYEQEWAGNLRHEWVRTADGIGLRLGTDTLIAREALLYDVGFQDYEKATEWVSYPALYAELSAQLGPVRVTPGVRGDAMIVGDRLQTWSVDPRVAARWNINDSVSIKASTGLYSQPPQLREVLPSTRGNRDVTMQRSWQSSAGVEWQVLSNLSAEVTGFTNQLSNQVVGREDRFEFYSGPPPIGPFDVDPYANDGVGTIYGIESMVRYDGDRVLGWVSATYSRSFRTDRPDAEQELFRYDQPLVVNALASVKLPRRWRLGGRFRYGSGNPYTEVTNRVYDLDSRGFVPVYGPRDGARLPPFWALDLRVDKDFVFDRWTLTTFLDVQNVATGENIEVVFWNDDYSELEPVQGLPALPVFGVRGEW